MSLTTRHCVKWFRQLVVNCQEDNFPSFPPSWKNNILSIGVLALTSTIGGPQLKTNQNNWIKMVHKIPDKNMNSRVGEKRQPQWSRSFSGRGHPYKENEWCLSSDRLNLARGHPLQKWSFDQWEGSMLRSWLPIGQNLILVFFHPSWYL